MQVNHNIRVQDTSNVQQITIVMYSRMNMFWNVIVGIVP